ncbi:MAG: hypothetical protein QOG45_8 [Chloroflexota bacterium]|jgi:uncharacterized membrane protein YeaQ/YmgE (transglycosylase-associated protein family)|nr:hypothetical protein [Chloroflexota bacterium]
MGHLIAWLLVGLIAGALAGRVVEGGGFGILGDIVVGLVGAVIGGLILHALTRSDVAGSFIGECIVAFVGACLLLAVLRRVGRGRAGGRGATAAFRR